MRRFTFLLLASLLIPGFGTAGEWPQKLSWDWHLSKVPVIPPAVDVLGLDLFDAPTLLVRAARLRSRMVFCYINAGAWEDWRRDRDDFPPPLLGREFEGWEGERWLDIRRIDLLAPVMLARLDLCAKKGFNGVEFDNVDLYQIKTGFEISRAHAEQYALWLAAQARLRGLSPGLKNVPELIPLLEPHFDWLLLESCVEQGFCGKAAPFLKAGKPVFAAEYVEEKMTLKRLCEAETEFGIHGLLKKMNLGVWGQRCGSER